jgi:hypothetical protein
VILECCEDDLEGELYLRAIDRIGWTGAVLQHQMDNKRYEKYLLNPTSFDQTLSPTLRAGPPWGAPSASLPTPSFSSFPRHTAGRIPNRG